MKDNLLMMIVILFLIEILLKNVKLRKNKSDFFDKETTNSLRGFWSIVILLVHVPPVYQNRIQDMIGSFAYIGVTFFFMTSAYGVTFCETKIEEKDFWKKRILKILVPCIVSNCIYVIFKMIREKNFLVIEIFRINLWVQWLLFCYFILWLNNKFISKKHRDLVTYIIIILVSLGIYFLKKVNVINQVTWCTEIYGFIYGILMVKYRKDLVEILSSKWRKKTVIICFLAIIIGIGYLKYKGIVFLGDYLLKILLGIIILLYMIILNINIKIGNKLNKFLGDISYEIYLIHGITFIILSNIYPNSGSGMFIIFSIIITIILSKICKMVSELILRKV